MRARANPSSTVASAAPAIGRRSSRGRSVWSRSSIRLLAVVWADRSQRPGFSEGRLDRRQWRRCRSRPEPRI